MMRVDVCFIVCASCVIFGVTFAAVRDSPCTTPNREAGTCIPVNSCRPIKQAIMYFDEVAIEFARKSQCGYEDGPLVCCGTVGRVTSPPVSTTTAIPVPTTPPPPATPIDNVLLPDRSLCGLHISENRTPAGTFTERKEFPWLVALKYTKNDGRRGGGGGYFCTGTLINRRYVLTAAECLDIPGFDLNEARLGEWKFSDNECYENEIDEDPTCKDPVIDLKVVEKISHPYYSNRSGNNNIALLRLETKINYNDFVRPICLPPSDYPAPPAGTEMKISGWNITKNGAHSDIKLKSVVPMVGSEDCNTLYPNYIRIYPNRACAGGKKITNLCNGDSGSPLMKSYVKEDETDEEQWYQEGIVHKVAGCEDNNYTNLYTRVSRYLIWILNNVKHS